MDPIGNFSHATCPGRFLPPCMVDPEHGHSVMFVGARGTRADTGEQQDHVILVCKQCAMAHTMHQALGPMALLLYGPDPISPLVVMTNGVSPDDIEKMLLDVLAFHTDDPSTTALLDEFRSARALEDAQEVNVPIVHAMSPSDAAQLFARAAAKGYPNTEEID